MAASVRQQVDPAISTSDLPIGGGAGQIPPSEEVHPLSAFRSGDIAATGGAVSTAHGLGRVPTMVLVIPVAGNNGMGAAGTQATTVTQGTHTSTNVVWTGTNGGMVRIYAI